MAKNLNPGQMVDCFIKKYEPFRRGVFVRYISPQVWPQTNDKKHCIVKFPDRKTLARFESRDVHEAMTDNTEAELKKIHSLIHQPSYAVVYPETSRELGYPIEKSILDWHNKQVEAIIEQAKPKKYTGGEAFVNVDGVGDLEGYEGYNAAIDQYMSNLKTTLYGKESTDE